MSTRAGLVLALVGVLATLTGCSQAPLRPASEEAGDRQPELGTCYRLAPDDVDQPSSDAEPVDCSEEHTAQTFAIGTLPDETGSAWDDPGHGRWVYSRCQDAYTKFLGIDESQALRVQLSWAWFRPSEQAWADGTRWYRCDLVGGPADATSYAALPADAKGLFSAQPPDEWLTCARGETVAGSQKVSCSQPHDWRAVTTIKLGGPDDPYPGEREVQVRTRDFCSDSVVAWLNYPLEYEFGFTWFGEAEWQTGNRRSVCWARIDS
ncbi:septum formation family protein [Nocardioides marmoraquaticus]